MLFFPPMFALFSSFSHSVCVTVGHFPSSRGVWDGDSDRGDHRKSVLPGECCPAEQMQGAGSGEALCRGDGLDPGQGRSHTGDQSPGTRSSKSQRSRPIRWSRVSAPLVTKPLVSHIMAGCHQTTQTPLVEWKACC